jgi:hypothetical protein
MNTLRNPAHVTLVIKLENMRRGKLTIAMPRRHGE